MIELQADIEGERELSRRLLIMSDGLEDFTTPLTKIAGELTKSFDENFDTRGSLFGGWAPAKRDYGHPLMEKTGEMRNSFDDQVFPDHAILSNHAPYFPYHQSNKPRQKLPRRVMMKIDQQRKTYIVKAFQEFIVRLTGGIR